MEETLYDVVIVGAGPAGLSAAITLKQQAQKIKGNISVCVLEKGASVGAHSLSGALLDPRALDELLPTWQERGAPLEQQVTSDRLLYLTESRSFPLPLPPFMRHERPHYIVSLGRFCRWLAQEAESMGVDIFPEFPAASLLYNHEGRVEGVLTQERGHNNPSRYQPGMRIKAQHVLLGEGCRGSLTKSVIERFGLDDQSDPQVYGLGMKEIWEIDPLKSRPGHILHTIGWPLTWRHYGGSFLYHASSSRLVLGLVVGLDYTNPYFSPYGEFQRFKHHPYVRSLLEGGRRLAYGARTLAEGGLQSLPKLSFPGGTLIGDSAGFLNVPRLKGIHMAMKSGMVAAECVVEGLQGKTEDPRQRLRSTWLWEELYKGRNVRPSFRWGLPAALAYGAFEAFVLRGKVPWTLHHLHPDHTTLTSHARPITYPQPDGRISFDRLTNLAFSGTNHAEGQPCHLKLKDPSLFQKNLALYDAPEQRYCPAGVYEVIDGSLRINSQNCLHCKACDIKDPFENITWCPPEGGDGPRYEDM